MINPEGLMMIEPGPVKSKDPVDDELTELARVAWGEVEYSGISYMGTHQCACGARSDTCGWSVRGMETNSLLVHYVTWHRDEVPKAELRKLGVFRTVTS